MTRSARSLILWIGLGQTALLGLSWLLLPPLLLGLPAQWEPIHRLAVALMLGVTWIVEGSIYTLFRVRWRERPRAETPVRVLGVTLLGVLAASLLAWTTLYHRVDPPYGLSLPLAALGIGAVVAVGSMLMIRQWLGRVTSQDLGDGPTLGVGIAPRRSRIGLRGYLLLTVLPLGAGSAALVTSHGRAQLHQEETLRRARQARLLALRAALRLSSVPRARLAPESSLLLVMVVVEKWIIVTCL